MYFVKTPWYLKTVYPSLVWDIPKSKTVYLTFDDGPVPGVTDKVLDILSDYHIKATFFCIGDNVVKHHNLFLRQAHGEGAALAGGALPGDTAG
ncbi:MAG TPA: polysaccharide deacetylase family protein, partial [Chitinophagales bacterium]|nr:polysaccharide deacetylase family protein [Chitinophagales bacterium]